MIKEGNNTHTHKKMFNLLWEISNNFPEKFAYIDLLFHVSHRFAYCWERKSKKKKKYLKRKKVWMINGELKIQSLVEVGGAAFQKESAPNVCLFVFCFISNKNENV
jgi:hypothetical protein